MAGEYHHGPIVQRGIDEALACRDMLTPAPPRRPLLARLGAWCTTSARAFVSARRPQERRASSAPPTGTGIHRSLNWGDVLAARALAEALPPEARQHNR